MSTIEVEVAGYDTIQIDRVEDAEQIDGYVVDLTVEEDVRLYPSEARALRDALNRVLRQPDARRAKFEAAPEKPEPIPASRVEETLRSYVELRIPVLLDYRKANGMRIERTVSPANIENGAVQGSRMLVGFDHARGRVGNFRLDRVLGLCPAPVEFEVAD